MSIAEQDSKQKTKKRWLHRIRIVGIIITILGWMLSNAVHFPFISNMVAPKYCHAISAFDKMHSRNFVLKEKDEGFTEISEILKTHFEKGHEPSVIKTLGYGLASLDEANKGMRQVDYIDLEILCSDKQSTKGTIYELKNEIEKRYLTTNFFRTSCWVFWAGIVISFIATIV